MAISRIIHSIWYQGKPPDKYEPNIRSVIEKNPGWDYKLWDEKGLRETVSKLGPEYLAKWESFPYMHNRIDMGRFALLFLYGGASVDLDVVALQGFDSTPYINSSSFIVSKNSSNGFENMVKNGQPVSLNNATILTTQYNPIMKALLDHILGVSCSISESRESCIQNTTGPREFTNFLSQYKDQITVLPNVYFEPCPGGDRWGCSIDPSVSVLDHRHEGSWVGGGSKTIAGIWYWIKAHKVATLSVIAGIILLISLSSKTKTTA